MSRRNQASGRAMDKKITQSVPTIDFSDFPGQYEKLRNASEVWGCFRILNHSIPLKLMQEMKVVVRSLLDLPVDIKKRNEDVIIRSGYTAPTPKNPLYESLGLYDIASSQAVNTFCSQLDVTTSQRDTVVKYAEAINELIMEVGAKLGESVGLGGNYCEGWPCRFRINKYNFTTQTLGSSGVQIHTDSGLLTILQDDESVGGLEVMDKHSGEFVAVDPMPGSFLVILGDMAAVWSNGRFCNVKHRVQCKEATIRVSIATFMMVPSEAAVEAPPEMVDADHPRMYVPFIYKDYHKLRITTKLEAGEALALLRTSS